MMSVKPDPDNTFQNVSRSPLVDEFYRTASQMYNHAASWSSSSRSFHEDSHHQSSRHAETSMSWPLTRQRFPDSRDAVIAAALEENYATSRSKTDRDEYSQRHGGSPGEDAVHDPWGIEEDRSRQSPPPPPSTSANSDPYRTDPGHHQAAAEFGAYRPEAEENGCGGDEGGLYRPRKLLADFYRHRERQDHQRRLQQQQEAEVETADDRLMGETGRWVKAASAYDGSPPAESKSASEADNFFNGRRLTWPLGTSGVPVVRRRQGQQIADQYVNFVEEQRSAIPPQSVAAAASPMSRLIQRYEHNVMTSSNSDAFPIPVSARQSPCRDWFPLSWQPPISSSAAAMDNNSSSTENSFELGEGNKTYSCHICSYIG